jgi:cell division protein FtsB
MTSSDHSSRKQWVVNYTQDDVDTIRGQIEQNEAAKRRWLLLVLVVAVGALVGAVVLLSTSYALYANSESDKKKLTDENAALKTSGDQCQQQLKTVTAAQEKDAQTRADAQSRLDKIIPAIIRGNASDSETAAFARMVSDLPHGRLELNGKPPDKLFRNYKFRNDSATEVYTLVGGLVDGKWVVHSNLVARRSGTE